MVGDSVFLGVKNSARLETLAHSIGSDFICVEARVHSNAAVITLVGQEINSTPGLLNRIASTLKNIPVVCIPDTESDVKLSLVVPQPAMKQAVELLHRELFQQVDPTLFAASEKLQTVPACATDSSLSAVPDRRAYFRGPTVLKSIG